MSLADYIASRLFGGGGAKPPAGKPKKTMEMVIRCSATVPANAEANSVIPVKFLVDPTVGEVTNVTVPISERWTVVDAWIKETSDVPVDGIAKLKKNQFEDHMITPPVSSLLVSNPSRPSVEAKTWNGGDTLSGHYITLEKNDATTAQEVIFYIKVIREIYE